MQLNLIWNGRIYYNTEVSFLDFPVNWLVNSFGWNAYCCVYCDNKYHLFVCLLIPVIPFSQSQE
jgi:hypothetical protein